MYIDKLAQGINPIDDNPLPEGDTVNNVRISRCFFFVSDVLRRVIENGGVAPRRGSKSLGQNPFHLTDTERKQFAFSDYPIPISEISKRLNALTNKADMKKITYQQIRTWLAANGILTDAETIGGGRAKHPTELGKSLGITVELRSGASKDYQVVLYNRDAQQFILDNIDAIVPM